jgi:hypothetical protein
VRRVLELLFLEIENCIGLLDIRNDLLRRKDKNIMKNLKGIMNGVVNQHIMMKADGKYGNIEAKYTRLRKYNLWAITKWSELSRFQMVNIMNKEIEEEIYKVNLSKMMDCG